MNKKIGLLMLALLFIPFLGAQTDEQIFREECSGAKLNGRCWIILPAIQKITYVAGIVEGFSLLKDRIVSTGLNSDAMNNLIASEFVPIGGSRFKEFVPMIDSFYKDRANRIIPISYSYLFATRKMNGATRAELDKYLADLRLQFSQSEKPKGK